MGFLRFPASSSLKQFWHLYGFTKGPGNHHLPFCNCKMAPMQAIIDLVSTIHPGSLYIYSYLSINCIYSIHYIYIIYIYILCLYVHARSLLQLGRYISSNYPPASKSRKQSVKKTCACMTWTQPQKPWRRTKTWRPYPAETPPLRESGADAFTASSSSMVYGVGLLGPAFPAFGPQVEWPDTNIGPTCPTPLVPKILPVVAIL